MAEKSESAASRWAALLPDAELLKQWQGVEEGLRRRRTLSRVGWTGAVAASILQVAVTVLDSKWLQALKNFDLSGLKDSWYLALPLVAAVVFFILYRWSRFWLQESEQPFRYTCSIEDFTPAAGGTAEPKLKWLSHHLTRRMNERIGRLRFAEEPKTAGEESSSHIHVRGQYIIREDRDGNPLIEVLTRVRIGGGGRPETLAHKVLFMLPRPEPAALASPDAVADDKTDAEKSCLSVEEYELLLERVYFSAASEIYRQIREDVGHKIDLLPTRRFKAIAVFHEAEDYARSGTLDAYQEARTLYERCAHLLDPALEPLPEQPLRRRLVGWVCAFRVARNRLRQFESRLRPSLAREEVLCARAELGYAIVLLQLYVIAAISGRRAGAVFEAPAVARRAIARLRATPLDTPDRRATLFRAYVVLAWACQTLDDERTATGWLREAQMLAPGAADDDMFYNLVASALSQRPMQRIESLRRALELQPGFETAGFSLAMAKEDLWRSRPMFERRGAEEIIQLYGELVTTNPGLIGAWANRGYVRWLIADPDDLTAELARAKRHFLNGRQYKEIKQETFVAELDYGLARIAAEQGDFDAAYLHCTDIASSMYSAGLRFTDYYFRYIGPDMLRRFDQYRERVERGWQAHAAGTGRETERRVRDSVMAFVLNDCGEAFLAAHWRTGDNECREKARAAYVRATQLDPEFSAPLLNLAKLHRYADNDRAVQYLQRCLAMSPNWPDPVLEMASLQGSIVRNLDARARDAQTEAESTRNEAETKREAASTKRRKAVESDLRGTRDHPAHSQSPETASTVRPTDGAETSVADLALSDRPITAPSPMLEAEADQNERDIAALFKKCSELTELATDLSKKADAAELSARIHAQRLLPHRWLWESDAGDAQRQFDWKLIRRADIEAELRWEREFSEWNAAALCTYAEALVMRPQSAGRTNNAPSELLAFARRHFWSNRLDSILALRHANGKLAAEDIEALRSLIERWLANDPANFSILRWWVIDPVIQDAPKILQDSVERNDLSPAAYLWIAEYFTDQESSEPARAACRRVLDSNDPTMLVSAARCCERLKHWDDALAAWNKALAAGTQDVDHRTDAALGRAVALWMQGEHEQAMQGLRQLAKDHPAAGDWRAEFMSRIDLSELDRPARQRLRVWLESQQSSSEAAVKADVIEALLTLAASQVVAPRPPDASGEAGTLLLPLTTPIALEGDAALFPGDNADELLNRLPQIRDRIMADLGARLPGVRIRGNDSTLEEHTYVLMLEEAPIAAGKVYPDRCVCPEPPAAYQIPVDWPRVHNPLTGAPDAVVVAPSEQDALAKQGCELWDHWEYMVRHLESVLRRSASQFFGLQELHNTLESWSANAADTTQAERRAALIEVALPDLAARVALLGALRALLDEQVSIADLEALLKEVSVHDVRSTQADALAEALRWSVRHHLAVREDSDFVHLSAPMEERLREGGPTPPLSTSKQVQTAIQRALGGLRRPALVVRDRGVRLPLRRVTSADFPRVPVFALRELPRPLRMRVAATAELA